MAAQGPARLVGIDYLRAFFSVGVVAVHLNYLFPSLIFDKRRFTEHTFGTSDLVNFYVLCVAVPVFVLISTYLYARKPTDTAGLGRRLWRIVRLLVFWSVLFQVYYQGGFAAVKNVPHPVREPHEFGLYLMSGGNTYYYFFEALAIVTIVTHLATRLSSPLVWGLFAASTVVVGVLPLLHKELHYRFLAHHANPLNFLPYAFAGVGLARLTAAGADRPRDLVGLACLALAIPATVLDWTVYVDRCFFEINQFAIPAYTRPSLVFLAVAVLVLALRSRLPTNSVVRFMALHSLGVYCLHPFFVDIKFKVIEVLGLSGMAAALVPWGMVLGLSYVGSMVMPLFLREDMIR
jgi:surface polysaccharide O-acyltransferase-like enzyme